MSQEHSPTQQDSDKAVLFCKTFQHEKSSLEQAGKFLGCQDTGQSGRGPRGRAENSEVNFPQRAEEPGSSDILSFSEEVDNYWMRTSQGLCPDPESLGRHCDCQAALPFNMQPQPTVQLVIRENVPRPHLSWTPPALPSAPPLCLAL